MKLTTVGIMLVLYESSSFNSSEWYKKGEELI